MSDVELPPPGGGDLVMVISTPNGRDSWAMARYLRQAAETGAGFVMVSMEEAAGIWPKAELLDEARTQSIAEMISDAQVIEPIKPHRYTEPQSWQRKGKRKGRRSR